MICISFNQQFYHPLGLDLSCAVEGANSSSPTSRSNLGRHSVKHHSQPTGLNSGLPPSGHHDAGLCSIREEPRNSQCSLVSCLRRPGHAIAVGLRRVKGRRCRGRYSPMVGGAQGHRHAVGQKPFPTDFTTARSPSSPQLLFLMLNAI